MSDEFISLATKEINEEISEIEKILNSCKTNDDVKNNSSQLKKHTHKIKGLAPMMGKNELGELSSQLDTMLLKISQTNKNQEIFDTLIESVAQMKNSMHEPNYDLTPITNKIKQLLSNL